MMHERRFDERQHDEDVHGTMRGKTGGANLLDNTHAPVDLHGPGVAALHLREELRRILLLDDDRAHTAESEVDGKGQSGRTRPDDENLGIHADSGTLGHTLTASQRRVLPVQFPTKRFRK